MRRTPAGSPTKLSRGDLMRIEAEDILASRVFDGENGSENGSENDEPDSKDVE